MTSIVSDDSPIIYDGRSRASEIKKELKAKIAKLESKKGIIPTLAILKVNKSRATEIYTKLKQKAAEEVGAKVEIYNLVRNWKTYKDVATLVRFLNTDKDTQGVMVQLPFPKKMKGKESYVLEIISEEKDADGMRESSEYIQPVVLAIMDAVRSYEKNVKKKPIIVVIGSRGHVGKDTIRQLQIEKYKVTGLDRQSLFHKDELPKDTDLLISATGKARLLGNFQVPNGVGVIDVGSPDPELNLEVVKDRLSFYTPVPGGIGPVTIAYLLENLYKAAYNQAR